MSMVANPDLGSAIALRAHGTLIDRPDLSGYRATAVVDWVDVEFATARTRSVYALRRAMGASRVTELTAKRVTGRSFRARIQDPASMWDVQARVHAVEGLNARLTGVEISVDLYPLNDDACAGMATMCAHMLRGLKNPQDFARFGKRGPGIDQLQSFDAAVRHFQAGHTCYLGHRADRHHQKIYLKRTNDSGKRLPASEHRVRIENTYFEPEGLPGLFDGSITDVVGRNDFSFRRMVAPSTPLMRVVAARVAQAGTRAPRSSRRLYDVNTKADTELNRRVYDGLRSLATRWSAKPRAAGFAGRETQVSLCTGSPSDYYTSVNTDRLPEAMPKASADVQPAVGAEPSEGIEPGATSNGLPPVKVRRGADRSSTSSQTTTTGVGGVRVDAAHARIRVIDVQDEDEVRITAMEISVKKTNVHAAVKHGGTSSRARPSNKGWGARQQSSIRSARSIRFSDWVLPTPTHVSHLLAQPNRSMLRGAARCRIVPCNG